jgi:hypothetical protein
LIPAVRGSKRCYPILLHKFLITGGEHVGQLLNALESASTADLRCLASEQNSEHVAQHLTAQMKLENKNYKKKQNLAAETTPRTRARWRASSNHRSGRDWVGAYRGLILVFLRKSLATAIRGPDRL